MGVGGAGSVYFFGNLLVGFALGAMSAQSETNIRKLSVKEQIEVSTKTRRGCRGVPIL